MNQNFKASTQYNDFVGSAAADRSDTLRFQSYLESKGLIREGEHVVGYEITFNGNAGRSVPDPGIVVYLAKGDGIENVSQMKEREGVFKLRVVEVFDLPLADFLAYFKRFKVMLANKSLNLSGSEYEGVGN